MPILDESQLPQINQPWWQLLSIQAAASVCLPNILIGQILCDKFSWLNAILAIGLGNACLMIVGFFLATLGTRSRRSTAEQAAHYFGNRGHRTFALIMIASMLIWFGIQLNTMSISIEHLNIMTGMSFEITSITTLIGLAITIAMVCGIKTLKYISNFTVPLLLFTLVYAICSQPGYIPEFTPVSIDWLSGVPAIIGVSIAGAVDLPTFVQHARSEKDAKICGILLYGLIVPLTQLIGVYLTSLSPGGSILDTLQSDRGVLWTTWVSCFVVISGWTANSANLYSAIAASSSFLCREHPTLRIVFLGSMGILFACLNPLQHLERSLDLIGITISSMGAVILSNYLFASQRREFPFSILSWILGIAFGIGSTFFNWFLTGVSVFDSLLIAFGLQSIVNQALKTRLKQNPTSPPESLRAPLQVPDLI